MYSESDRAYRGQFVASDPVASSEDQGAVPTQDSSSDFSDETNSMPPEEFARTDNGQDGQYSGEPDRVVAGGESDVAGLPGSDAGGGGSAGGSTGAAGGNDGSVGDGVAGGGTTADAAGGGAAGDGSGSGSAGGTPGDTPGGTADGGASGSGGTPGAEAPGNGSGGTGSSGLLDLSGVVDLVDNVGSTVGVDGLLGPTREVLDINGNGLLPPVIDLANGIGNTTTGALGNVGDALGIPNVIDAVTDITDTLGLGRIGSSGANGESNLLTDILELPSDLLNGENPVESVGDIVRDVGEVLDAGNLIGLLDGIGTDLLSSPVIGIGERNADDSGSQHLAEASIGDGTDGGLLANILSQPDAGQQGAIDANILDVGPNGPQALDANLLGSDGIQLPLLHGGGADGLAGDVLGLLGNNNAPASGVTDTLSSVTPDGLLDLADLDLADGILSDVTDLLNPSAQAQAQGSAQVGSLGLGIGLI